jgi:gas vesicle protein
MLFAEFDWNQVLIKGLIGGVIGGLVGLFIWIGKKASGNDTRDRKRDDYDDD